MTNLQLISLNLHFSSHQKNIPMYHNLPSIYHSRPYTATPFFKFKNGGMPLFMPSTNSYQWTISSHHTNISEQNIRKSHLLSSNQTYIIKFPQQKKTMKHSHEHSEFILVNITPSPHQKHQNRMSNSLYT